MPAPAEWRKRMPMCERLTGLIAAPHTPMRPDGDLNLDVAEKLASALVADEVRGAFVCGSTGEAMSLTAEERMHVAQRWCDVAGGDFKIIVHVGGNCLRECRALAAHARKIGAHAVGAFAPHFYKPSGLEALADFCGQIASAAPDLPFYYYHIPFRTGVHLGVCDLLKLGSERIASLAGVKFTCEDLMDFGRCVRLEGGRFNMLFGRDEMLLAGLVLGADGAVGSTYNYAAPLYQRILAAYRNGDLSTARECQGKAADLVAALQRLGGLSTSKAIMKIVGLDCGPLRPPLQNLSPEEFRTLRAELERVGFFEYCTRGAGGQ